VKCRSISVAVLLGLAAWQIGAGLYIPAKAMLAQILLRDAWRQTLAGAQRAKPWPWADTWPVARLRAPEHDIDLMVLAGASGARLAFGPGHLLGTPAPGQPGNSVIGGHRDTSLGFLRHVKTGDLFVLGLPDGNARTFKVTGSTIADARKPWLSPEPPHPMLTLVTCYPFDAIAPGGPLRYLVFAEATDTGNPASGQPYSAHGYNPRRPTNR
jgi:sortase A